MKRLIFIALILAGAGVCKADITTGLVGHWKLNEGSGTTAEDDTSNNFDGTMSNVSWETGKIGTYSGGFSNASNSQITVTDNAAFHVSSPTVAMWIYISTTTAANRIMFGRDHNTAGFAMQISAGYANTGYIEVCMSGGFYCVKKEPAGYLDKWTHLVFKYDGTDNYLYLDGTLVDQQTGTAIDWSGSYDVYIGNLSTFKGMDGKLDDVRFYDRPLSSGDITELFNYTESAPTGRRRSFTIE